MSAKCIARVKQRLAAAAALLMVCIALFVGVLWLQGLSSARPYLAFASLRNIYQGLRYYDELNGHLPVAASGDHESGESCSWRIEVYQAHVDMGLIESPRVTGAPSIDYDRDNGWSSPANLRLERFGAPLFQYTHRSAHRSDGFRAYYMAITGPDTAFDPAKRRSLRELPHDLILVARVEQSKIHWMEPGDLTIGDLVRAEDRKRELCGEKGYAVLFADGSAWILSGELPFSKLCTFFTITGSECYDRENVLGRYRLLP